MRTSIKKIVVLFSALLGFATSGYFLWAAQPDWWTDYSLIDGTAREDEAAATVGQAKHAVQKAHQYLEAELASIGGSGAEVTALYNSYCLTAPTPPSNDLQPLTIGQLKYLAKPFYDRINSAEVNLNTSALNPASTEIYPWTTDQSDDSDLSTATLGQLKFVFSFNLSGWSNTPPELITPLDDLYSIDGAYTGTINLYDAFEDSETEDANLTFSLNNSVASAVSTDITNGILTLTYEYNAEERPIIIVTATDDNPNNPLSTDASFEVLDIDFDDIRDSWEEYYFGNLDQPSIDSDGDGASDLLEYHRGTDPTDDTDFPVNLPSTIEIVSPMGQIEVPEDSFLLLSAYVSDEDSEIDYVEFNYFPSDTSDTATLINLTYVQDTDGNYSVLWYVPSYDPLSTNSYDLQAVVVDIYGSIVESEKVILNVIVDNDKDEDQMPDDWEDQYPSLDTSSDDAFSDPDTDGFVNIDEYRLGTNPESSNVDTDIDGIPDEVENQYSALDANTASDVLEDYDDDGFPNIFEVYNSSDPDDPISIPSFDTSTIAYFKVDASLQESEDRHFSSITGAVTASQDYGYSIIEVLPGSYEGSVSVTNSTFLFASNGPHQTVINTENLAQGAVTISSTSVLDGFTIRDSFKGISLDLESDDEVFIRGCVIKSNGLESVSTYGGGISVSGGNVSITACRIHNNQASLGGAAIYSSDSNVFVERSDIRGNQTLSGSGAIHQSGGMLDIQSTVIMDNTASESGAALYLTGTSQANLAHSTLAGNTVSADGTAIYLDSDTVSITATNSIFWNPVESFYEFAASAPEYLSNNMTLSHSLVHEGTIDGIEVVSASNPLLTRNGHLQSTSPAINLGISSSVVYDIDGEAYPSVGIDLGADEYIDTDTPKDGLPDWYESTFGVDDANANNDTDTLTNLQEYLVGGDPTTNLDMDGDSLPDDWELSTWELGRAGLNPNQSDSPHGQYDDYDGDGNSNYFEFIQGTNPNDASDFTVITSPTIVLDSPRDKTFAFVGDTVALRATVSTGSNPIDRVEFFANNNFINDGNSSDAVTYIVDWLVPSSDVLFSNQHYQLKAVFVDSYGHRFESEVKNFAGISKKETQLLADITDFATINLWLRPFDGLTLASPVNPPVDIPEFVQSWQDQSDTSLILNQSNTAAQPKLYVDFIDQNIGSAMPIVRESLAFDGVDDVLSSSASTLMATDTHMTICIAWMPEIAHDGVVWSQDGMSLVVDAGGYYYFDYQGFCSQSFGYDSNPSQPIISVIEIENAGSSGSIIRLHHNGYETQATTVNLPSIVPSDAVFVGDSVKSAVDFFQGQIFEILVAAGGVPTSDQLEAIFDYFEESYQLELTAPLVPSVPLAEITFVPDTEEATYLYVDQPFLLSAANSFGAIATYEWDFESDGTVDSTNVEVTTSVASAGTQVVHLKITDVYGQVREVTRPLVIRALPVAAFSAGSTACDLVNSAFTFDASASSGDDLSHSWDFGDGQSASGQIVDHIYSSTGSYNVTLTVNAPNLSLSQTTTTNVTVQAQESPLAPVASLSVADLGQTIDFSITEWSCADVTYDWDFGDGSTANGATVSHGYSSVGNFTVTVTASAAGNVLATGSTNVSTVGFVDSLEAKFSIEPSVMATEMPIVFNASAATGFITIYEWDFGDGSTVITGPVTTHQWVSHVFAEPGNYTVTLTVRDGIGNSHSANLVVSITEQAMAYANEIRQWVDIAEGLPAAGASVALWEDRSVNALDCTQTTVSQQPVYIENADNTAQPSSHVLFDGVDDFMVSASVLDATTPEQAVQVAWTADEIRDSVIWSQGELKLRTYTNVGGSSAYGLTIDGSTILVGHVYSVSEDNVSVLGFTANDDGTYALSLFHNGVLVDSSPSVALTIDSTASTHIGRSSDTNEPSYYKGKLRSVLVTDGVPSELEAAGLFAYAVQVYRLAFDEDSDADALPDWWEQQYALGDLNVLGAHPLDYDGDGLSDFDEYQAGSNPADFFNGSKSGFWVKVINTAIPQGAVGSLAAPALVLEVRDDQGALAINAPLTLSPEQVSALLTQDSGGSALISPLMLRTDVNGQSTIYVQP